MSVSKRSFARLAISSMSDRLIDMSTDARSRKFRFSFVSRDVESECFVRATQEIEPGKLILNY